MCVSLTRVVVRTRGRQSDQRCGGEGSCVGAEGEYDSGVARPRRCALGLCVFHAFGLCVYLGVRVVSAMVLWFGGRVGCVRARVSACVCVGWGVLGVGW